MQGEFFVSLSVARKTVSALMFVASLLTSGSVSAQEYSFRNFAGSEGLGNLSIQKIYQDPTGFIWVSTENGIFRYNGDRFDPFGPTQGIPAAGAVDFGEAPEGSLLVGGAIGLYRLNGNRFEKLSTPFKTVSKTQGIQSDAHGNTYLATDSGVFEMTLQPDHNSFAFHRIYPVPSAPAENASSVFVDKETIWFGCGLKLCKLDGTKTTVLGEENGLLNVPLAAILKDHLGNLWVRARNEGVLEWPAGESRFRRPDTPVPGSALTGTPALDRDGRILLGRSPPDRRRHGATR